MSTDSKVSSLPMAGWSCSTLMEGVEKVAALPGLKMNPEDAQKAGQPWKVHLKCVLETGLNFGLAYIYI